MSVLDPGKRSMASVGIVSIAAVIYFGVAYDRYISIVPKSWYEPMALAELVQKASALQLMMFFQVGIFATVVLLPPVIFLFRGQTISSRHAVLLLPLITSMSLPLWGAYWWGRGSDADYSRTFLCWQMQILNFLLEQTYICLGLVLLITILSSRWRGERKLAIYILFLELMYCYVTYFVAGMATTNIWF